MYKLKSVSKLTLLLISIVLLFSSCGITDPQVINVKDKYSITLPWGSMPSKNLNSSASLQYTTSGNGIFVIVIDEAKEAFKKALIDNKIIEQFPNSLEGYTSIVLFNMKQKLKEGKISETKDIKINNMDAKAAEINAKISGVNLYYNIAFVKGKDTYYQILTWTRTKRKIECKEEMDKIIHSFKEL